MKLSRFFHHVKIENNVYAIYNSLVMEIAYVDSKTYKKVIDFSVSKKQAEELKKIGVYVSKRSLDDEALKLVRKRYEKVTGKVNIMYFIMSSACNLGCKYCFIENCQFNNNKEINMSEKTALEALIKYTDYLKLNKMRGSVIFYGGEPLVNWKVIKLVLNKATELSSPIDFSMVTNATLLDKEKIEFLAEKQVEIGISIDGPKELNDKNRVYRHGNKSVYDEVIKKFPYLELSNAKFGLSITVSEDLLNKQDEVLNWLKKLGVKSIFYNLYHYTSYDSNWESYYKKACDFLIKSYKLLSSSDIYDGRIIRKIDSFYNNEFKFSDCGAIGANQLAIKPNGDICICHGYLKTDKYVIGNIKELSIEEIMNSDEIKFWKERNTLNNKKCLNCNALFICGGGCAIQAEALFDDRKMIDKPFCIHTKKTLSWILKEAYQLNKKINNNTKEVRQ